MPRLRDLRVGLGLDWGNSSPGCVVFGAALPDGHVHIWDELKFQRETAASVAGRIKERCKEWGLPRVPTTYCDPSLLPAKEGELGEWIGLTLRRHGVPVVRVSNDRVNGWQRLHEALAVDPVTGTPWLTLHPRCKYGIRTFPLMVQAKENPEDLDSDSDDHFLDAARYLLMGGLRPTSGRKEAVKIEPYSLAWFRQRFADRHEDVLA